jgi:hypothetical protein
VSIFIAGETAALEASIPPTTHAYGISASIYHVRQDENENSIKNESLAYTRISNQIFQLDICSIEGARCGTVLERAGWRNPTPKFPKTLYWQTMCT